MEKGDAGTGESLEPPKKRSRVEALPTNDLAPTLEGIPPELLALVIRNTREQDLLLGVCLASKSLYKSVMGNHAFWRGVVSRNWATLFPLLEKEVEDRPGINEVSSWYQVFKKHVITIMNWDRGKPQQVTIVNKDEHQQRKEAKLKRKQEGGKKHRSFFGENGALVEDIEVSPDFIVVFSVSTTVDVYSSKAPHAKLHSFSSGSSSFDRRKRIAIAHSSPDSLSLVVIGPTLDLWKVARSSDSGSWTEAKVATQSPSSGLSYDRFTDFALDTTEDPPFAVFTCMESLVAAKIHTDRIEIVWKTEMDPPKKKEPKARPSKPRKEPKEGAGEEEEEEEEDDDDEEEEHQREFEFQGTKYDYLVGLAMNKRIAVAGADSGLLRVYDRNTGEKIKMTSVNDSGWSRNSIHRMAMHEDLLVVVVMILEGGGRADSEASVFLIHTEDRRDNGQPRKLKENWSWWPEKMRYPPVDAQSYGVLINAERVVVGTEVLRVFPLVPDRRYGGEESSSEMRLGTQAKFSSKPLTPAASKDDSAFEWEPEKSRGGFGLGLGLGSSSAGKREDWSAHSIRALWMDHEKLVTGDGVGIIRIWSFVPSGGL